MAKPKGALVDGAAERERAGETLRRSQERYRTMADALPVLVWQSGTDKLCTYFNRGWLEFTGRTMEQELGNGWVEGIHPDDLRRCLDTYNSAFDRREPFVVEYRLRHRSGEYRWILDRGAPQFSSDGTFLGYIGGAVDTHDRKQAEQALRESEQQVRHALEFNQAVMANMAEGFYTLDSRGLVTYMNPAAERLFGWRSAELLGRKMHDMTHYQHPDGSPFPADECAGLQVLQNGKVLSDYEEVFIRKDGTFFPVVSSFSPIKSEGVIVGLVVVFRDMTAEKRAEEALHRSREELRALAARLQAAREEERTQLARDIHDELSGTLTALKMDLSLLPDRVAKDHSLFLEKLSSMSGLVDRTLDRVHTIVTELRPAVLDKFGLVAAIEWQTGEFQDRSGIACQTHLPTEEIPLEPERSTAVFRILQEALTNVARHANASKVVVDLRSEAGSLILEVRDNGKGIDENAIYAHNSMGMLSMRERALSFGGKTEVTRLPEGGTLVSVRIPQNNMSPLK
ncbi:MAG: PAS domain S-box protein [Deltaproteobacteria bacterium]|nr:PAS domain S-box protein [Deltaproteobacteria bacterium]